MHVTFYSFKKNFIDFYEEVKCLNNRCFNLVVINQLIYLPKLEFYNRAFLPIIYISFLFLLKYL